MNRLNNSFPCYYLSEKYEGPEEVEMEEKGNTSTFNLNFNKIFENLENVENNNFNNFNSTCNYNNFNFSPPKKKNSLDISYSIEQTFCENSHINIEEEFHNEETYLKIGNEGQSPCIDPIQEVESFERENNESFIHENNYLIHNLDDTTNSFEGSSSVGVNPWENLKFDSTLEDTEIQRMRRNILSIKLSKSNTTCINQNKSDINLINHSRKQIFTTTATTADLLNTTASLPLTIRPTNTNKLNQSCSLSFNCNKKKRGRKKFLFDGLKTEIIDKAFLREFKNFIKRSMQNLRGVYDELKSEEKIFWNEFMQNVTPPFFYTQNGEKIEYKSFNKHLLKFIFSRPSVRQLYGIFIKEREKDLMNSILNKKIKKIDRKMLLFYTFYGKNLHKLYSEEFNMNDINFEDIECLWFSSPISDSTMSTSI